ATGTSMMAIILIASLAVALQLVHHNVDVGKAALVGVPALGGAVAGTALQQRLPQRAISVVFAVLLLVIAAELAIP
ncbi:MAG: TSUP family transporter, partial [Solirubrobacterales bacterium]